MPRVAFFGSGSPASLLALEAVAAQTPVVAVVLAGARGGWHPRALRSAWRRRRAGAPLRTAAGRRRIPVIVYRPERPARLAEGLRALQVELICVATFRYLLPGVVLQSAREAAIGLHPSALPRHRGPDPIFWTYHADDAETGVSVFRLDDGTDAGDILGQERLPVARGLLGSSLYLELARRGAALLARTVADWPAACAAGRPQVHELSSQEPAPRPGRWRIDYDSWSAERVWHFLRGVGERGHLLQDARGRTLRHGPARSFRLVPGGREPGTVEVHGQGLTVHCRDGVVDVAPR